MSSGRAFSSCFLASVAIVFMSRAAARKKERKISRDEVNSKAAQQAAKKNTKLDEPSAPAPAVAAAGGDQTSIWASRLRVSTKLAMQAGQAMLDARGVGPHGGDVTYKGRHDLVTKTDRSNEELIERGLKKAFPGDKFLGEEASAERGGAPSELAENVLTWIVDPIDGTTNFVHGFPATCVSIGLARGEEILVAVIYNPFTTELYQAVKGYGAYLDGQRLAVSKAKILNQSLVVSEYSYLREEKSLRKMMETTGRIAGKARAVRMTGCGAMDLCYLARGSVDAVYGGVAGVWKPWDWAAGVLIAKEAGAKIFAGDGAAFKIMGDTILGAATPELASALTQLTALSDLYVEKMSCQ